MTAPTPAVRAPKLKLFAALAGVTSLGIFVQAILAGMFIDRNGDENTWMNAHSMVAYVVVLASLGTLLVALWTLRSVAPTLWWGSVALFVLLVVQTVIGRLITKQGDDGLIAVHVPLAFIVFALTLWLSVASAQARRTFEAASGVRAS